MKNNPEVIFCLSSGMSRTSTLFYIFSLCFNTHSRMMNNPKFSWETLRKWNNLDSIVLKEVFKEYMLPGIVEDFTIKKKYVQIDRYVSFVFCKTACEVIKSNLAIVHLINNAIDSSLILYEHNKIPDNEFILSKRNRIKADFIKYREFNHDFFKTFWFNLESYVRSKDLISRYRDVKHYVFFSKWLDSKSEIRSLLNSLNCKITNRRLESASKINKELLLRNSFLKKPVLSRDKALNMAKRFISKFGENVQLTEQECNELILL